MRNVLNFQHDAGLRKSKVYAKWAIGDLTDQTGLILKRATTLGFTTNSPISVYTVLN